MDPAVATSTEVSTENSVTKNTGGTGLAKTKKRKASGTKAQKSKTSDKKARTEENKAKKRAASTKSNAGGKSGKGAKSKARTKANNDDSAGALKKKRAKGRVKKGDIETKTQDGENEEKVVSGRGGRKVPCCVEVDQGVRSWQSEAHLVAEQPIHVLLDICQTVFNTPPGEERAIQWDIVAESLRTKLPDPDAENCEGVLDTAKEGETYLSSRKVKFPLHTRKMDKVVISSSPPDAAKEQQAGGKCDGMRPGSHGGPKHSPFTGKELRDIWKFVSFGHGEIPHSEGKSQTWIVPDSSLDRMQELANPFSEWFCNSSSGSNKGKAGAKSWRKSAKQRTREIEYRAKKQSKKKDEEQLNRSKGFAQADPKKPTVNNATPNPSTAPSNGYPFPGVQQQPKTIENQGVLNVQYPMMTPEMALRQQQLRSAMMQQQVSNQGAMYGTGGPGELNPSLSIQQSNLAVPAQAFPNAAPQMGVVDAMAGFSLWIYEHKREYLEGIIKEIQRPIDILQATRPEDVPQAEIIATSQAKAVEDALKQEFLSLDLRQQADYIYRATTASYQTGTNQNTSAPSVSEGSSDTHNLGQSVVETSATTQKDGNEQPAVPTQQNTQHPTTSMVANAESGVLSTDTPSATPDVTNARIAAAKEETSIAQRTSKASEVLPTTTLLSDEKLTKNTPGNNKDKSLSEQNVEDTSSSTTKNKAMVGASTIDETHPPVETVAAATDPPSTSALTGINSIPAPVGASNDRGPTASNEMSSPQSNPKDGLSSVVNDTKVMAVTEADAPSSTGEITSNKVVPDDSKADVKENNEENESCSITAGKELDKPVDVVQQHQTQHTADTQKEGIPNQINRDVKESTTKELTSEALQSDHKSSEEEEVPRMASDTLSTLQNGAKDLSPLNPKNFQVKQVNSNGLEKEQAPVLQLSSSST